MVHLRDNSKILTFFVFIYAIIPLIHSKVMLYGTVVHRASFFWIFSASLLLITFYNRKLKSISFSKIDFALIAVSLAMLTSCFFSVSFENSFFSNFERMMGFNAWWWFMMFYLCLNNLELTNMRFAFFQWLLIIVGVISAFIGIKDIYLMDHGRLESLFSNPMHASYFYCALIIISIRFFFEQGTTFKKALLYLSLLVFIIVALMTKSRGGILALAISMFFLIIYYFLNFKTIQEKPKSKVFWIVTASFGIVLFFVFGVLYSNFSDRIFNSNIAFSSISIRLSIWEMVLSNFDKVPFFGFGEGNFNVFFINNFTDNLNGIGNWFDSSHNWILDRFVNFGYLGLFLFLGLYVIIFYSIGQSSLSKMNKGYAISFILFHLIFMLSGFESFISNYFFIPYLALININTAIERKYTFTISRNQKIISILSISMAFIGVYLSINTFNNVSSFNKFTNENNLTHKVTEFEKTYEGSHIGRSNILYEMCSQRGNVLSSNLPQEEKDKYFNSVESKMLKYLSINPQDYIIRSQLAYLYSDFGQQNKAIMEFEKLHNIAPNRLLNNHDYAVLLAQNGNTKLADEIFGILEKQEKSSARIILTKAILAKNIKETNELISKISAVDFISSRSLESI
jgi:O-antigen ligase